MKFAGYKFIVPLCTILIVLPSILFAQDLDLNGFQRGDGAITTGYGQNMVDPYFATQALLIAKDGGLKIRKPAKAWIQWALKRQQPDGLFSRYMLNTNGGWDTLSATDADDAMLAIWIDLIYQMTSAKGMPNSWSESVAKAEKQLDVLYDPEQGIYHISSTLGVGLLMDNVEISLAFKEIAREQKRLGMTKQAHSYEEKSRVLAENIHKVFGTENDGIFRISTQEKNGDNFYPDRVGQIYPVLKILENNNAQDKYTKWMEANGKEWLSQRKDDYPWGLVAIAALAMHDSYSASCWQNTAEPMRYSSHWNVIEEVALQDVKWQLGRDYKDIGIPCVGGNLS